MPKRPSLFSRITLDIRDLIGNLFGGQRLELPQIQPLELQLPSITPRAELTPEEQFIDDFDDNVGIERLANPPLSGPNAVNRGPYYGVDQFLDKIRGMGGAWHLISRIVIVSNGIDRYYIRIEDSE